MSNEGSEAAFVSSFYVGLVMGQNYCHNIISSSFAGDETGLQ